MTNRNYSITKSRLGFTMIELMLVIIIGVGLGAYAVPRFMDTKNMNAAREEVSKLSELKTQIESMYQFNSDFQKVETILQQIAPSTFERHPSGTGLLSIWKNGVNIVGADGSYTVTYDKVPSGKVCQEFIRGTQRQGWLTVTVGKTAITSESTVIEITQSCDNKGVASATQDIEFVYNPRG